MTRSLRRVAARSAAHARATVRAADDRRTGRRRVHFLHVGKTGGTAVKAAFGGGADVVTVTHRLLLHPHGVTLADVPDGEQAVVVVRDPVARFVSGFNSGLRCGRPRYDVPWSPAEAEAFSTFRTPDALARALTEPGDRDRAERAMHKIRHVREPLTTYLGGADGLDVGRIALVGHLDDLPGFAAALAGMIGAPPVRLPDDDVAAHRAPAGSATRLSPVGEANVRRWYAGDLAVIGELRRAGLLR